MVPYSVDLLNCLIRQNWPPKEQFRTELNINDGDFIVSYLGSIGGWYLTKEMLQFAGTAAAPQTEAKFLFISNNNHRDIIDAAKEFGIPADRIMVKFGRRDEVPVLFFQHLLLVLY